MPDKAHAADDEKENFTNTSDDSNDQSRDDNEEHEWSDYVHEDNCENQRKWVFLTYFSSILSHHGVGWLGVRGRLMVVGVV